MFSCWFCALKTKHFYLEKRLVRNALIEFTIFIHLAQGSQVRGGILLLRSACHEQTKPSAPGNRCGYMPCLSSVSRRYFKMNAKVSICKLLCIVLIIQLKKGPQQHFRLGWDRLEELHYPIWKEWSHADSSPYTLTPRWPSRLTLMSIKKPFSNLGNVFLESVCLSQREIKFDRFINTF